jgi:molybdopterin-containing oxidoreductase family iron-sulfur binding subunit
LYQDETARYAHWHIPESHFLESWGDALAYDGTVSIIQPLIAPLYESRSLSEFLASLTDNPDRSSYQLVREFWQGQRPAANFEEGWEQWLHDGVVAGGLGTKSPPGGGAPSPTKRPAPSPQTGELEIVFRPDPSVWDGRFANSGWLQELPKPHTKITWDNAAYISPSTAERLKLENGDLVDLEYRGKKVTAPVWIVPGQAVDSVTVFLGYGRTQAGRTATNVGYNANVIRTLSNPHADGGLKIQKLGRKQEIACTQEHHSMEGRDIIRVATNAEYTSNPHVFQHGENEAVSPFALYPEWQYTGYRWGMAIDQNACIGCNACIVACQTENNIPIVGKDQVARGREMHWIRVDRYHTGSLDNPRTHFQPVLCMHCEKAPCEPVCPVAATVHSGEGLNQMVYNRCVGTRYCSNNCPYKVRRFNFYLFNDWDNPTLAALRNPDVTTRSRGVMEKCTYCVQRIQEAKIEAEKADRKIHDEEIITACQGVCPTNAIIFGDLNDKNSRVFKLKESTLNYGLLTELATQPRTTYMAKLINPNPELEKPA